MSESSTTSSTPTSPTSPPQIQIAHQDRQGNAGSVQVAVLLTLLTLANLLAPSSAAGSSSAATAAAYRRPKPRRPIPICQYARAKKSSPEFDLECECAGMSPAGGGRLYSGRLSAFLAQHFKRMPEISGSGGNRSVVLRGCRDLNLELDFGRLGSKKPGATLRLRIEGAVRVHVSSTGLAFGQRHILELSNIGHRVSLTGEVFCFECKNMSRSSATQQQSSPTLLSIEATDVPHLSLYDVRATVPVQLTAKNGASLTVVRSTFATLPWPGIYVYNVTRASIANNRFLEVAPKAVVAKMGSEVVIAHNVLDVSSALDVTLFSHMTIRCNRPPTQDESESSTSPTSVDCDAFGQAYAGYLSSFLSLVPRDWKALSAAVIGADVVFGVVFVTITIVAVIVISSFFCCCCCGDKWDYEKMRNDGGTASPELAEEGIRVSSTAKTLVSTRPILKKGKPKSARKEAPAEKGPLTNFVRIDKVSEKPVEDDDHEEGVVCGSITLGGDWPHNVRKIRALAGSPTPTENNAERDVVGGNASDEKRLKKRARNRQRVPDIVVSNSETGEGDGTPATDESADADANLNGDAVQGPPPRATSPVAGLKTINEVVIRPKGQQKRTRGEEGEAAKPVKKASKAKSGAEDKSKEEPEPRRGSLGRVTTV